MSTPARLFLPLVMVIGGVSTAFAAPTLKITKAFPDANERRLVFVTFDQPTASTTRGQDWSVEVAVVDPTSKLTVSLAPKVLNVFVALCGRDTAQTIGRNLGTENCPAGDSPVMIVLELDQLVPAHAKRLEVTHRDAQGAPTSLAEDLAIASPGAGVTFSKPDDSDIVFNGKITAGAGAKPLYDFDAFAGYMHELSQEANRGKVGVYGQAKGEKWQTGDPNSYLGYVVYERLLGLGGFRGPFQTPRLDLRPIGIEFDKDGAQRNLVVMSPVVSLPVRFTVGSLGIISPALTVPQMTLQVGAEFIKPLKTALDSDGWRARGLFGASFRTGYAPESDGLHSITLTASYVVRVLSEDEIFKHPKHFVIDPETGKEGDPVFESGRQPRPNVEVEFSYNFVKYAGLSVKYEYGSLPPAFALTDHKVTVGIKASLKQTSYARYAILKP